jgi:hypothetical protein
MTECDKEIVFALGEQIRHSFIEDGENSSHVHAQIHLRVYTSVSCLDERRRPSKRAPLPNKTNR